MERGVLRQRNGIRRDLLTATEHIAGGCLEEPNRLTQSAFFYGFQQPQSSESIGIGRVFGIPE